MAQLAGPRPHHSVVFPSGAPMCFLALRIPSDLHGRRLSAQLTAETVLPSGKTPGPWRQRGAMSLTVKGLNGDTTFLLTFSPPFAPTTSPELFPGSFTILVDPWISGPAKILSPKFSISEHTNVPCIMNLADLPEPDIILISQDKPDHCHEETLRQLPPNNNSLIIGTPAAAKKIRGWNYFDPSNIEALSKFDEKKPDTVFRLTIPPFSPSGSPGELTVALLPTKFDITGLHNAIGITYRPPSSVLTASVRNYISLPPTPPASPNSRSGISATPRAVLRSPLTHREKTLSIVYSPHGASYGVVRPYATSHLVAEAALPLTALVHSFDRVQNPWVLGGNVSYGFPGGVEIARNLLPQVWIGAHDEDKDNRGFSVMKVKTAKFSVYDITTMLRGGEDGIGHKICPNTLVVTLAAGDEFRIDAT